MEKKCEICKHFYIVPKEIRIIVSGFTQVYICRRYPPHSGGYQPEVKRYGYCGEFNQKLIEE